MYDSPPVFSICQFNDCWLWAAWNNPNDAKEFFYKTDKSLTLDCLLYSKVKSREEALKQAKNILGNHAIEIKTQWAEEIIRLINEPLLDLLPTNNSNNNNKNNDESKNIINNKKIDPDLEKDLEILNSLIGLKEVKSTIQELVNIARIAKLKSEMGLKTPTITRHLVFTGNAGTGKTTVARIIGNIYKKLNMLSQGHFVEVDRGDLVAEYLGQTAPKTAKIVEFALGGVLFIDEAYSLVPENQKDMFGQEAISTLLKMMEDNRDNLVVIVAGYKDDMKRFINANQGLKSRFAKFINFVDYKPEELSKIFNFMAEENGYHITSDFEEKMCNLFRELEAKIGELGNGRFVRNIFDRCLTNQCNRLANLSNLAKQDLITFQSSDIPSMTEIENNIM
ncbi:AAA family ATPase [Cyanobacterium sp. DS4]|uniref:AAA family ATPase n=1 Tax=Cyanobacterium sp. DS4 TaxID=2878255 RepID=UPI002E81D44B|nr:AAA family ATPase [Cyanobacterium sp. Dongsha4]WVL01222.1 AAA family ATPase [Cyanobacterium sp. Dongsha4]